MSDGLPADAGVHAGHLIQAHRHAVAGHPCSGRWFCESCAKHQGWFSAEKCFPDPPPPKLKGKDKDKD